jgi:Virulence-associated protein E-like domain/RepB DNA-primase N-terminal domain
MLADLKSNHPAQQFLTILDPEARIFTFQTFDDNERRKLSRQTHNKDPYAKIINAEWEECAGTFHRLNQAKAGIYITVNQTDLQGRRKGNITRVRAVFCEYDRNDGAIDVSVDAIASRFPLTPTMIVESSPGKYHFYWCVSDEWPVSTINIDGNGNDLDFSNVMACMVEKYGSDKACTDQSRVLRVPGYYHNKRKPHLVKLIYSSGPKHIKKEIVNHFQPGMKVPSTFDKRVPPAENAPRLDTRWHDKALAIELDYLAAAEEGKRNSFLNMASFRIAQIWEMSDLSLGHCEERLSTLATAKGLSGVEIKSTIASGFKAGKEKAALSPFWVDKTTNGAPDTRSIFNVASFLDWADIKIRWNEFSHKIEIAGLEGFAELNDAAELKIWSGAHAIGFRVTRPFLFDCLNALALHVSHHPVIEYFDNLTWDKTARLDMVLTDYAGAEDNEYTRCVAAKTMIAMVRRIRKPGTKFDQMPVAEGPQGIGKSSFLRLLTPNADWFTDDMAMTLQSKEINEKTEGIMLAEVPELQKMRAADLEHIKAMISRQVDKARPAYGRRALSVPRQFIMWGTVNTEEKNALGIQCAYLKDPTGNRRFWPLRFNGKVKLAELKANIDQIWAEAVERERNGESIEMPEALWKYAEKEQNARMEADPWIELLSNELGEREGKILIQDIGCY